MAPQVSRLVLCFFVLIVGFLVVRSSVVPKDFGRDGWHPVDSPRKIAGRAIKHAGKEACKECHEDKFKTSPHVLAGVACETCHGPAKAHVDNSDQVKPFRPSERAFCQRCHEHLVGRRSSFPQIDPKTHNPGKLCIECHVIHPSEAPAK